MDRSSPWNHPTLRHAAEPVADDANHRLRVILVRLNVLPGNVGNELLIAKRFPVQDQAAFLLLLPGADRLAARNMPSSNGMLKRGRRFSGSGSVREMS